MIASIIENVSRRDRAVVGGALATLTLLAWFYTIRASIGTQYMGAEYMFLMWAAMMVAMMTPSAAPMVFAFSRVSQSRAGEHSANTSSVAFLLGYLTLWIGFSALAAAVETMLGRGMLISPTGASTNRFLSAGLLLAAGFYQYSPWKNACLTKCRTPLGFLLTEWRDGRRGAFVMGMHHGLYCAGCCWLIMALLFVAGTMNLAWIAILTLIVVAEKMLPFGERIGKVLGLATILGATWFLLLR